MTDRFLWVLLCAVLSTWGCATDEDNESGGDTGSGGITGNQDGGEPDGAIPDMAAPDMAMPDVAAPDMAMPDMAAPDMAMPDATVFECVEDADCAERGEVCLENVCVPPPPLCEGPQDCGDEQTCEEGICVDIASDCVDDTDCFQGQVCVAGECVDEEPPAGCINDDECPDGPCLDGICVAIDPECGEDTDCEEGMICDDEFICVLPCQPVGGPLAVAVAGACIDNCPGGLVCDDLCGACVEAPIGLCEADADCPEGTICQEGACVDAPMGCEEIGCPPGLFCENGECVDGPPVDCAADNDCPGDLSCFEGLCLPIDPECRADDDCEPGFFCIEGACVGEMPNCQANNDCNAGEMCLEGVCEVCFEGICDCQVDADCAEGEACFEGACAPNVEPGCQADEDCAEGEACIEGFCNFGPECFENADCGGLICVEGSCGLCDFDEQCDPGASCLQGVCIPNQEGCQADEDCGPDGICFDGVCEPGQPAECMVNEDCAEDEECLNGSCFPIGADMCAETIVLVPPSAMGTYNDAFPVHVGSCGGDGSEVIFEYTSAIETILCLDTFGSLGDTVLYVRTICGDEFSEVACNDDSDGAPDLESQVEFLAEAGVSYSIFVDSYDVGGEDDFVLNLAEGPCPDNGFDGECFEDLDCPDAAACIEGICEFPQ